MCEGEQCYDNWRNPMHNFFSSTRIACWRQKYLSQAWRIPVELGTGLKSIWNTKRKRSKNDILNIHGREGDNTLVRFDFIFFNLFFDTEIIILTCGLNTQANWSSMAFEKAYRAIERHDRTTVAGMLDRGERISINNIIRYCDIIIWMILCWEPYHRPVMVTIGIQCMYVGEWFSCPVLPAAQGPWEINTHCSFM